MPGGWKAADRANCACDCLDVLAEEEARDSSSDEEPTIQLNKDEEDKLLD